MHAGPPPPGQKKRGPYLDKRLLPLATPRALKGVRAARRTSERRLSGAPLGQTGATPFGFRGLVARCFTKAIALDAVRRGAAYSGASAPAGPGNALAPQQTLAGGLAHRAGASSSRANVTTGVSGARARHVMPWGSCHAPRAGNPCTWAQARSRSAMQCRIARLPHAIAGRVAWNNREKVARAGVAGASAAGGVWLSSKC